MKRILSIAVILTVSRFVALAGDSPAKADSTEIGVRAAEIARETALVNGDLPALEELIGDDFTCLDVSGKDDTKASYLEAIRSGHLRYATWQLVSLHIRMFGQTAVLDGMYYVSATDLRVQKDPIETHVFFLAVYVHRDGRWQQVAWQATKAPNGIRL